MKVMLSVLGLDRQASSALQVSDMMKKIHRQAESEAIGHRGVKAQIESSKILADQREEMELMRSALNSLLKHSLELAEQQSIAAEKRDKIEAERYQENMRWTKIAAWSGVVAAIFAILTIALQIFH